MTGAVVPAVKAIGLLSPVGFNAPSSCAAIRGGIRGVRDPLIWDPESGEYLPVGRVPLPQWWEGTEKLADLVAPAIAECLEAVDGHIRSEEVPLMLCISEVARPFRPEGLDARLFGEIEFRLEKRFSMDSLIFARGQAGVAFAFQAARDCLFRGAPCCIVAGVDSTVVHNLCHLYLDRRRLLCPGNSNGFSAGEAGAALLLVASDSYSGPQLQILGVGIAHETATIESGEPLRARGLTQAIRTAMTEASVTMEDVSFRVTDLNGEHYKFREAMLAALRFPHRPKKHVVEIWHPIEYLGEIGAAIGPCSLAMVWHAGVKGYAPGNVALCHFGSEQGDRAAIVVRFVNN